MKSPFVTLFSVLLSIPTLGHTQTWLNESSIAKTERTQAQLIAYAPSGFQPGGPVEVGLLLTHAPDWHTYWKNSGESGLPTTIEWRLPTGATAEPMRWPTPKRFQLGPLANYGYDGTVLLSSAFTLNGGPSSEQVTIGVSANWLACRQECVPESAELTLTLPTISAHTGDRAFFEAARRSWPHESSTPATMRVVDGQLKLDVEGVSAPWQGQRLDLFPETEYLISAGATPEMAWSGDRLVATIPLSPDRELAPRSVAWVLAHSELAHGEPAPAGLRVVAQMQGEWPEVTPIQISPALSQALQRPVNSTQTSWWGAFALAFLGGVLLNLMPCVFPVLAIKVLGMTQQQSAATRKLSGLAYTLGVVASFAALAAVLFSLRSGGLAVGWGFQLQEPWTVAGLAILFALIGLNLAGLFEVNAALPSRLTGLRLRHPVSDSLWSGVLATAVASPCTAPFMGAALGYAITLPAWQGVALFAGVGLGMAAPYLLLSWVPALGRFLPKPGPWMVRFKELMAFPMFATVVWLLWVLGQQGGINASAALLLMVLSLAFLLWLWRLESKYRMIWRVIGTAVLIGTTTWVAPYIQETTTTQAATGDWQPWSTQAQQEALANSQAVFVDFTAAWCVTCQVNKINVLSDGRVKEAFANGDWLLLRADWTKRDPEISTALNQLGRTGVPTYAVYHPNSRPKVLNELLSVQEVLTALSPDN